MRIVARTLFTIIIALFSIFNGYGQSSQELIKINQSGYYVKGPKIAVLTSDFKDDDYASRNFLGFFLLKANSGDTVFKDAFGSLNQSKNSTLKTRIADFSAFEERGRYIIYIPGIGNSYPFEIKNDVHREAATAVLKGFYYQRVSMPLEEKYAGKWKRPAGHPDTKVEIHPSAASEKRPAGSFISSPGGWYDAGDYNKYIVNSGITCGTLLAAYEDFPAYFESLKTNIPESNNRVPDILDETLYNLRWMLTMQDPNDGGVYNKCTNASFDGMVMPGYTKLTRYVVQKSTAATLDFSAVMAQAARIFKKFGAQYRGLSDSCLKAAVFAWQWSQENPSMAYNQNEINTKYKPAITTGGYGDRSFRDEWFWAASELLATTGGKVYLDSVSASITDPVGLPSWANVKMLGYYTLLRFRKDLSPASGTIISVAEQKIVDLAKAMVSDVDSNAFRTVMGGSRRDFIWGSSSVAANQGILLINAYLVTKDKKYTALALSNLDYLLGRNATGYSFLTGIGHKQTMRPHHRPSIADAVVEPVPGLLSGGPNPGRQDKCHYDYSDPERAFSDTDCSYASNEIAINWNAPAVYLFNAIEALQKESGY